MTVEGKRGNLAREEEQRDRFPVGMRVLAVDDDPICLRILETLLRKCQYQGLNPLPFFVFLCVYFPSLKN